MQSLSNLFDSIEFVSRISEIEENIYILKNEHSFPYKLWVTTRHDSRIINQRFATPAQSLSQNKQPELALLRSPRYFPPDKTHPTT